MSEQHDDKHGEIQKRLLSRAAAAESMIPRVGGVATDAGRTFEKDAKLFRDAAEALSLAEETGSHLAKAYVAERDVLLAARRSLQLQNAAPQASVTLSEDKREGGPDTALTREDAKPGRAGACGAAPSSTQDSTGFDGETPRMDAAEVKGWPLREGRKLERELATCNANRLLAEHERNQARVSAIEPLPMVLHCPACGLQHVDAKETHGLAEGEEPPEEPAWNNPPHRSHLCHGCGCIWRPADVPTNGVKAISTRGKADTWPLPEFEQNARADDTAQKP